jgi:2-oxoisovalerate dehydrogenase E1 component
MATPVEHVEGRSQPLETHGLTPDQLVGIYRTMYTSRAIDDREIALKRQNKVFFQISGAGHEAVLTAAGLALRSAYDWFYTYYRDRALCLQLGVTPYEMFLESVGAASDPASGGRQMPSHWGHKAYNLVSASSPTGTQFLQGVGCAEAAVRASRMGLAQSMMSYAEDEVTLVCAGDGTTSEGEFWESLSTASNLRLPVIFLIEDNGYAISVPVEVNTPGGNIARVVSGFPDLLILEVDGTDPLASYAVVQEAAQYCRERHGPALVRASVTRPYSHSMSDDERLYKPAVEQEEEEKRDPIPNFAATLVAAGVASEADLERVREEVNAEVSEAADRALEQPQPGPETVFVNLYSPEVDPRSDAFATEPHFEGNETTMVDLINACLTDEMERDPRIVVFGEDVADVSRDQYLDEVKGKGGVFKVTAGLQRRFGSDRVFNSPLAEANIVGRAIGMATRGLKPVCEIQFFDYIWPAFHQLRNEITTMRWRSNGAFSCPVVVRTTYGGYLSGGAVYHSQTGASIFTHTSGMHVICPSNALDANGLLRTAIRCEDPVLFLEHKHLYRQTYNKSRNPGPDFMIPFGRANLVREGRDVTVVTYGALVERTRKAVRLLEKDGRPVDVELIDLRSLSPLDMETISASVKKTNKVIVAHEDSGSWGIGAEIAARIADEVFEWLDGPVRRVTATDTLVGYAPSLENEILPQVPDLAEAIAELAAY